MLLIPFVGRATLPGLFIGRGASEKSNPMSTDYTWSLGNFLLSSLYRVAIWVHHYNMEEAKLTMYSWHETEIIFLKNLLVELWENHVLNDPTPPI